MLDEYAQAVNCFTAPGGRFVQKPRLRWIGGYVGHKDFRPQTVIDKRQFAVLVLLPDRGGVNERVCFGRDGKLALPRQNRDRNLAPGGQQADQFICPGFGSIDDSNFAGSGGGQLQGRGPRQPARPKEHESFAGRCKDRPNGLQYGFAFEIVANQGPVLASENIDRSGGGCGFGGAI